MMNNPPTWEIMIIYDEIPFTKEVYKGLKTINIDECDEISLSATDMDEKVFEVILSYMSENAPLDSVNKAFDLFNHLEKTDEWASSWFYSPILIQHLTSKQKACKIN